MDEAGTAVLGMKILLLGGNACYFTLCTLLLSADWCDLKITFYSKLSKDKMKGAGCKLTVQKSGL